MLKTEAFFDRKFTIHRRIVRPDGCESCDRPKALTRKRARVVVASGVPAGVSIGGWTQIQNSGLLSNPALAAPGSRFTPPDVTLSGLIG
jgi:hypothetical protein